MMKEKTLAKFKMAQMTKLAIREVTRVATQACRSL